MAAPVIPGVDYAWGHPGGSAIKAAGYKFACRYSSNDPTKDISKTEAVDLAAHDVWTVVVRETTANRAATAGRAGGVADATAAVARARAAGMPEDRPLYFAIDFDAPAGDAADIQNYFRGVNSVIGVARTGVYGGYDQISMVMSAGLARWIWQTVAWSGGRLYKGRNIYQYAKTVKLGGVVCDINEALTADYGQWMPGKSPVNREVDMAEWTDKLSIKKGPWSKTDQTATAEAWLMAGNLKAEAAAQNSADAVTALKAQAVVIAALTTKVDNLGKVAAPVIDYAKLAAALLSAIKEA